EFPLPAGHGDPAYCCSNSSTQCPLNITSSPRSLRRGRDVACNPPPEFSKHGAGFRLQHLGQAGAPGLLKVRMQYPPVTVLGAIGCPYS
ncbi:hypothetical protein KGY77_11375, partial [Candidatus Bipolaricaulota bacterium]|nr:hypothetical protein [Candidatus Bipolaricaulota bacterium]